MMSKRLLLILLVVGVLIVSLGVWIGYLLAGLNPAAPSPYSAVTMATGEIYFGRLHWFPWPKLKEVWTLQRTFDAQGQVQFAINPLRENFWGPVDVLYLNPRSVISWVRLRNDSQVVQAIRNPAAFRQQPVAGESAPPPAGE